MSLDHFYSRSDLIETTLADVVPASKKPFEVYGICSEFLARGGKRLRPLLCLSSCELCGGEIQDSLSAACAIELFHNFTLIHDDIEDNSQMRRAKPCLHIAHGLPLAINAGDGLFMLVWECTLGIKAPYTLKAQKILLDSFTSVLEGQALELAWHNSNRWNITTKDYLEMAGGKTASLIRASCHVGAFLAGADSKQQDALCTYGWNIGLAFQIQDDILNLIGDEKKYKKEIGGDIREGKRTLMVIDCLNKMPVKDATKLRGFLGKNGIKHEDVLWCIDQLKTHGSIDYAQAYSKTLCKSAVNSLSIFKDHDSKSDLLSVAKYSVDRQE